MFFIHPTTYVGTEHWNAPIGAGRADEIVDHIIMPGQASIFNGSCRVYAPRYRQATLSVFFSPCDSGREALDVAFADIKRAFRHYMKNHNNGRPFFIAGHSQGCAMAMRLLAEEFGNEKIKQQLIAAYLLGFKVTDETAADMAHVVTRAERSNDLGVFVALDTFLERTSPISMPEATEHWTTKGWIKRAGKPVQAINPLSWTIETSLASEELHKGIVVPMPDDPSVVPKLYAPGPDDALGLKGSNLIGPLKPGLSAQLDDYGFLKISKPVQQPLNVGVFGGNYHNIEVGLFYMNLRENVADRLAAYVG